MSKISNDLIQQIQDEINRRGGISGSLDEVNKIAAEVSLKYNQSPNHDLRSEITQYRSSKPENLAYSCFIYRMFEKGVFAFWTD